MNSVVQAGSARRRVPLLALGFVSLATGIAGGLVRIGVGAAPAGAIGWHGALLVCGFFGTVISLERAVALGRPWAYLAPLLAGLGGVLTLIAPGTLPFTLFSAAACALLAANVAIVRRQPSLETVTLAAASAAWLAGNVLVMAGGELAVALPWWIVFFVLTIGAERLELSRYAPRPPAARHGFAVIAVAIGAAAFVSLAAWEWASRLLGGALLAQALWLYRYDIARVTVKQQGLTRYIAVCLLAGYAWLAAAGVLLLAAPGGGYADAALHALLVGYVFSMVFGHAPVILPAVLHVALPYGARLYLPLAILHVSVALRVAGGAAGVEALRVAGSAGNAVAIALFIITAASLALARRDA